MSHKLHDVNITFTDEEFDRLKKKKEKLDLNWHDFVLLLAKDCGGSSGKET